ncbi:Uncharacterised protein [Mycobacteroides abscessus subsp. massiliense]|nr:Uncharacterised protein [Mycobacteroides abscessus subsp. massiliense]
MAIGRLHTGNIRRHMHNHQAAFLTFFVRTNFTQIALAKCVTHPTMLHLSQGKLQSIHQLLRFFAFVL